MLPPTMDQFYWDSLLEMQVLPNSDEPVYTGHFFEARRALQIDQLSNPYRFKPTVSKFNRTLITIKFNFGDPSKLEIDG
jgi:hypothetical protein